MGTLYYNNEKTLKLTNVFSYVAYLNDDEALEVILRQMQNYIRAHGSKQIGPLIQYTKFVEEENNNPKVRVVFLMQCDKFINNVSKPYKMNKVIRVPKAMYCRYIGPEETLKFGYDKIYLEAFENDIALKKESYVVYVDKDDENITADIFIERED